MKTTSTVFLFFLKKTVVILFLFLSAQFSYAQPDSTHFVSTWLTTIQGASNAQSITIFTAANTFYNYDVDWDNDGVFEDTNVRGNITHQYPTAGRYTVRIRGVFPRIYFGDSIQSNNWQTDRKKLLSINQWGSQQWKNFSHAFNGCENMSLTANDLPNLDSVKNMSYLFANVSGNFNNSITNWDVSQVTNMEGLFKNTITFNQAIGNWQVDSVKNMKSLFEGAIAFNQPIGNWNVDNVKTMESMFWLATSFNQPIGNWNVNSVTNMWFMFWTAISFNQPIGNWDVSNVRNMRGLFKGAIAFNQPLNNWNVSNVTDMAEMLGSTYTFNQPLNNWDVSSVTDMTFMFNAAYAFNQSIENWNVSSVNNMQGMFRDAVNFDQDICCWDVSNVNNMQQMFKGSSSFNQNLSNWSLSSLGIRSMRGIFDSCGLSTANYDSTLMGWQAKPHPTNLELGAANLSYCASDSVRNLLINNSGWTFVGDTLDCVTVGIDQKPKTESSFKVYPNPSKGQITIENTAERIAVPLLIFNTQGQKVKSIRLKNKSQTIDLSELAAGLYFLVQDNNRQKLLIEK